MPLHVSSTSAHHQDAKIVLYSLWYHHTYRWPSRARVERGDARSAKYQNKLRCFYYYTDDMWHVSALTMGHLQVTRHVWGYYTVWFIKWDIISYNSMRSRWTIGYYISFYKSHCTVTSNIRFVTWRWPIVRAETCRQDNNKNIIT